MWWARAGGLAAALLAACSSGQEGAPGGTTQGGPEPIDLLYVESSAELLPDVGPLSGLVATLADVDGDGRVDIVQPTEDGVVLYLAGDDGTFSPDDGAIPALEDEGVTRQVLAGDFDGDGDTDLLLLRDVAPYAVLMAQDGGSFEESGEPIETGEARAISGATLDADGDGDLDAVVTLVPLEGAPESQPRVQLLVNDGFGTLVEDGPSRLAATGLAPYGVAVGDVDGDGHPDLFFSGDGSPHRLLVNDGQGVFRDGPPDALPAVAEPQGRLPALGDLDGDGMLDIVVPSANGSLVWLNGGGGRFYDETPFVLGATAPAGHHAIVADVDLDEHADLVLVHPGTRLRLYRNDGAGRLFDYSSSVTPWGPKASGAVSVGAADFDGDGDLDLFVSRGGLARPWLLVNWHPGATTDGDGDGVPDDVDNCPDKPNPDQQNRDAYHFACESGGDCAAQTGCELVIRDGKRAYLLCRDKPLPWAEARAFCQGRGADLLVIDDSDENDFVTELTIANPWLGLSDTEEEGTFAWVDGQGLDFKNWNEGEPNDSGGVEDCGQILTGDGGGKWNDLDCAAPQTFVCEDKVTHTPADPGDACDVCPGQHDPDQDDSDDDGIGDVCDAEPDSPPEEP